MSADEAIEDFLNDADNPRLNLQSPDGRTTAIVTRRDEGSGDIEVEVVLDGNTISYASFGSDNVDINDILDTISEILSNDDLGKDVEQNFKDWTTPDVAYGAPPTDTLTDLKAGETQTLSVKTRMFGPDDSLSTADVSLTRDPGGKTLSDITGLFQDSDKKIYEIKKDVYTYEIGGEFYSRSKAEARLLDENPEISDEDLDNALDSAEIKLLDRGTYALSDLYGDESIADIRKGKLSSENNTMPQGLVQVVRKYVEGSAISNALRGVLRKFPGMDKEADDLDKAIDSFGKRIFGRLYRGILVDNSVWDNMALKVGSTVVDPGFMSTSRDANVARKFSDGSATEIGKIADLKDDPRKTRVIYKIETDSSVKGLQIDGRFLPPDEEEILLPRGLSFEVLDIQEDGNLKTVTLKTIPPLDEPDLDQGLPGVVESDTDISASSLQDRSKKIFDQLRADLMSTPKADPVSVNKSEIPAIAARDVATNKSVVASVLQEVKDAFRSPAQWIKNFTSRDRKAPVNPLSKQEYKAFNLVALAAAADKAGYSDPRWLTKAEAEKSYGAKLNPDATPTMIAVPVLHSYEDENGNKFESVRFTPAEVYNAEQFSGMPAYEEPTTVKYTPQEAFEVILDRFNRAEIERMRRGAPSILGMKIDDTSVNPDTGRPIRSPNYSRDRIKLPLRSQFKSDEAWVQSLAHELIHSTGAAFRQNRPETQQAATDSTQRAREEVIAEMASAILMKKFGLDYDTKNSATYIKTQALNEGLSDEDISDAAIKAQAAIDYMLGNDLDTIPKWDPSTTKRPQTPTEFRNTELTPLQSSINPDTSQASIEALNIPELSLDQDVSSSDKAKQKVYDALIEKLTKLGNSMTPWRKPFKDGFEFTGGSGIPRNPSSKRLYSGFNSFWLKIAAMSEGYTDSRWMTYKQALALGGQVRLGEKGVPILVPMKFPITKDKDGKPLLDKNGKETRFTKLYFKAAFLFNVSQIDGLNLPDDKPSTEMTPVEAQDFIIDRYGKSMTAKGISTPKIDYSYVGDYSDHSTSPNWRPFDDTITLPGLAQFNSPEEIFDTLMHELTHSTGHARRLDRTDLTKDYANPNGQARAQEELIAEMGAAILGEMFGVNYDVDNTQAYMQSWFSVLKDGNPELLQIAASKAQQAVDYMLGMDLGDWSPLDGYNTYLGQQGKEGDEE